jgi:hypothetical protein
VTRLHRRVALLTLAIAAGVFFVAPARGAMLSGSFSPLAPNSVVNLTTNGLLDWIHWGYFTETSLNRKAGVLPRISDFTELGAAGTNSFVFVFQVTDLAHGYSWTDGTPEPVVNDTHTGVWAYGLPAFGTGFEFTVPADTTMRTLKVYLGLYRARGDFEATLSDGSAPAYMNSTLSSSSGSSNRVYTVAYAAASPGKTLRVRWTFQSAAGVPPAMDANVTLHAAALSVAGGNNPPSVVLTSPDNNANYSVGGNVMLSANATDFDGTVSKVEFFADGVLIGQDTSNPYSASWRPSATGRYQITAEATDNDGDTGSSLPIEVFIHDNGGSLAGSVANPPLHVNLTTEGTADWAHWGLTTTNSFNHKAGVGQSISQVSVLGSQPVMRYTNNYTHYSWSDGTPVAAANDTPSGVFIIGQNSGFALSAPADTTPRQLKLYLGGYGVQANFQAWLSDFSAPAYTDTSVSNVYDDAYAVYTLDYAAASAGQSLIVQYRVDTLFDGDFGNVTLQAATLTGPPAPPPLVIANPAFTDGNFTFSFLTEPGTGYSAQRATSLVSPIDWQTFTNVAGNGSMATVTDANLSATRRFYRVRQP